MFLSGEEWRGPSQNWTLRGLLSCQLTLSSHSVLSLNHCAFDMWRIDPIHMLLNSISDSHLKGDFQHSGTCLTMSDSKAKDTRWALLHFSLLYGWLLVLCVIFLNWRKDKSRVNQPCCSRSQCCQSQFHCPLPYSLSFSYRSAHSICVLPNALTLLTYSIYSRGPRFLFGSWIYFITSLICCVLQGRWSEDPDAEDGELGTPFVPQTPVWGLHRQAGVSWCQKGSAGELNDLTDRDIWGIVGQ